MNPNYPDSILSAGENLMLTVDGEQTGVLLVKMVDGEISITNMEILMFYLTMKQTNGTSNVYRSIDNGLSCASM